MRLDVEQTLLRKPKISRCDTKWYDVSWLGILLYVSVACLNYVIGYYVIYRQLEWNTAVHSYVRVFGDIVTVGWFALGFVSLPWHQWEQHTCVKTRDCMGVFRFLMWWIGTVATFLVYGYLGQFPAFQTSLDSYTPEERNIYVVAFSVIGLILLYWLAKLCPCSKSMCDLSPRHKFIFLRLLVIVGILFIISYIVCLSEDTCVYHLHHWWFGFVLILLSTTVLENWLDYFLQGVFWTFLIESLFNYRITFGEFFV